MKTERSEVKHPDYSASLNNPAVPAGMAGRLEEAESGA